MVLRFIGVVIIIATGFSAAAGRITWQGAGICVVCGLALFALGRSTPRRPR